MVFSLSGRSLTGSQKQKQTCGDFEETGIEAKDMKISTILVGCIFVVAAVVAVFSLYSPDKRIKVD